MTKTPEEIKSALLICSKFSTGTCRRNLCPYFDSLNPAGVDCIAKMACDAYERITQLEKEVAEHGHSEP